MTDTTADGGTLQTDRTPGIGGFDTWVTTAAVMALAAALYALFWTEGIHGWHALVGADLVLRGEVPYRDFWTMYFPGHFYLLAALFALFGKHVMVSAVSATLISAIAAGTVHRLGLVLTGCRLLSLALGGLFVAALFFSGYFRSLGTYPPAITCAVIAMIAFVHALRDQSGRHWAWAGAFTGFAALFKHDVGAYAFVSITAGLLVHQLLTGVPSGSRFYSIVRPWGVCAAMAAVPVAAVVLLLAPFSGPEMFEQTIRFAAVDFKHTRSEYYPRWLPVGVWDADLSLRQRAIRGAAYVSFALPMLVWAVGVLATLVAARRRAVLHAPLGVAFTTGWILHHFAAHVQVNTHIVSLTLYAGALGTVAVLVACDRSSKTAQRRIVGAALIASLFWMGCLAVQPGDNLRWKIHSRSERVKLEGRTISGLYAFPADARNIARLQELVERHVPPDEAIFVGEHRHDIVISGKTYLYFALDRPVVGRFFELHPGVVDTAPAQDEIIRDLELRQTPLIILGKTMQDDALYHALKTHRVNLPDVGATNLDKYIGQYYDLLEQVGSFQVLLRRSSTARSMPGPVPNDHV